MLMNLIPENADDDFVLRELVREGGDPHVERSSSQIASIEQAILAKLQKQPQSDKKRRSFLPARSKQLLAVAAGVVLVIWLGRLWTDVGVQKAWSQVAETMRGKPWVHGLLKGPDSTSVEIWLSPAQMTAATRIPGTVASFGDFRACVLREFNPSDKVISLRPIDVSDLGEFRLIVDVFEMISENRDLAQLKRADLLAQSRREVKEGGNSWTEIEFTLRRRPGQEGTSRLVFRIDPATLLPTSLTFADAAGPSPNQPNTVRANRPVIERRFILDYPATGPADIYALGVPKDARIVDCGATADARLLVKAIENGRPKFDRYTAIVVPNFPIEHWWDSYNGFYRVYRKGDRWRVEQCWPSPEASEKRHFASGPADDTDHAKWWLAEARNRFFFPLQIFNGNELYGYEYNFEKVTTDAHGEWRPVLTSGPRAEPVPPSMSNSRWFNVMPELVGRPLLGIPSPHLSVDLDAHPNSGPSGTVLLTTKSIKAASIHGGTSGLGTNRYWVDPSRNYLVMRWEVLGLKDGKEMLASASQILKTGVTSHGQYYPLEVRFGTSANPETDQVFHFYIDFNADVPDALLDPNLK